MLRRRERRVTENEKREKMIDVVVSTKKLIKLDVKMLYEKSSMVMGFLYKYIRKTNRVLL